MEQQDVSALPEKGQDGYEGMINKGRTQLKSLREALIQRMLARVTGQGDFPPDLRPHPDQYPPLLESNRQWEVQVARVVVMFLLDLNTKLPVEVDTMHRRLLQGPMGVEYERNLNLMGFPNGPQPLIAKWCSQKFLDAVASQLGPRAGGCPRRMWIVHIERATLAGLVGVNDPMPTPAVLPPAMQQALNAMHLMLANGPGGPGQPMTLPAPPGLQGPPGFMPVGGHLIQGPDGMPSIVMLPGLPPPGHPPGGEGMQGPPLGMMGGDGGVGIKRGGGELDLDALLSKKTQKDRIQMDRGTGAELQEVLARPTAREAAKREVFRTADGASAIQEHCSALTKEECKRVNNSPVACPRLHFKRVIRPHTDVSLGNCSYLNTCRNFHRCKYIHYDIDDEQDEMILGPSGRGAGGGMVMGQGGMIMGGHGAMQGVMGQQGAGNKPPVPKYLQALKDPQWICCDIRKLDMRVLGKFGVIMADPPWQIHQDLPYGTMEDDEMRRMDIGCLQDDGVIFLWVTGRAMELGRECLKIWGYDRVDELIWVKTNQLNRLIRTGRTGHWINHSKEHCLVGYKGNPSLNKYVDCDVVVAEVRETSRKPDEMYPLLERLSPGTRKLEIFARSHNRMAGWVGLGNQLPGVEILEPEFRSRYIAKYGPVTADGKLPDPPR